MKKFTRNFLLGEHSIVWFLRKVGLGLALVLWTTLAFAQDPFTYQLKVASWDSCYQTDNTYSVPVHVKDFMKIMKFDLVLNYTNTADFDFIGLTDVNKNISSMTVQQLTDGNLTFKWQSTTPVSILPAGSEDPLLFVLNFKIAGFQHHYLNLPVNKFLFTSKLAWTKTDLFNDLGQCAIKDQDKPEAQIIVREKWESVVVDYVKANCYGDMVTVNVTTPANEAGMLYSFNGNTYQPLSKSDVFAPSANNQLVIKDAKCISYVKKFDVESVPALQFSVESPVYTLCPDEWDDVNKKWIKALGDIEIVAENGKAPYTYYVIPEEQWISGDKMRDQLTNGNTALLSKYDFENYVIQKPAGKYMVAVQDANGCASLTGTNLLSWWQEVEVINDKTPIAVNPTQNMMLTTTCFGQCDARISYTISGGTPFTGGYNIYKANGQFIERSFEYDSNEWCDCSTTPQSNGVLCVGTYEYIIIDANGCARTFSFEVKQPAALVYTVDHANAGCGQDIGEIWIASVDSETGSGATSTWRWHYSTDPDFETASPWLSITTKAVNLAAGIYYVEMEDGNGCSMQSAPVKVLTTGFDLIPGEPIKCAGGTTSAKITVANGASHTFKYQLEKWTCTNGEEGQVCGWTVVKGWQDGNEFTGLLTGKYRFSAKDVEADCIVPMTWEFTEPVPLKADLYVSKTVIPSCSGLTDGNVTVQVTGGTAPYYYNIDNQATWWATNKIAMGVGKHTIAIKDSKGCTTSIEVEFPTIDNKISFVDKINLDCKGNTVTLFKADAWTGNLLEMVGFPDKGYLESINWYPAGLGNLLYKYKNSEGVWVEVPYTGNLISRISELYYSTDNVSAAAVVAQNHKVGKTTEFAKGIYYLAAKDEFGCISNVEKLEITENSALEISVTATTDMLCHNTYGEIVVKAWNGKFAIPGSGGAIYQYVLLQLDSVLAEPKWDIQEVDWRNFEAAAGTDGKTPLTIAVPKGNYWLFVRDYCAYYNAAQIQPAFVEIKGYDAVSADITPTPIKCNGDKNGSVKVVGKGGLAPYSYELTLVSGAGWPSTTTWPFKNTTGEFNDLYAGIYKVTVKDTKGCTPYVKEVTVGDVGKLVLELIGVDASCYGVQDGIIRYKITGGTAPFEHSTDYNDVFVPVETDRRAGAGTYHIILRDKSGCTASADITINQPQKLAITKIVKTDLTCSPDQPVSGCGDDNKIGDGTIKVSFTGGWNVANDGYLYYVSATQGAVVITQTLDTQADVSFVGLGKGDWTIKVYEWNPLHPSDKPYVMNPDYATAYKDGFPSGKQNPYTVLCNTTVKVSIGAPEKITYVVDFLPVDCFDEASGEIYVKDVKGGTPPYRFWLEGPAGYTGGNTPVPANGALSYTFTGLTWGFYNVHVTDSKGCQICSKSVKIENQLPLTMTASKVKDAGCYGATDGALKINVSSFPEGYTLKFAIENITVAGTKNFPTDVSFLNGKWVDSPEFNAVGGGTWATYVKATNATGTAICYAGHLASTVVINQSTEVKGYVWDKFSVKTLCNGSANGKIKVSGVSGGTGPYAAYVTGLTVDGQAFTKFVPVVKAGDYIDGIPASTDLTALADSLTMKSYSVKFIDNKGCESAPVQVAVMQPDVFTIKWTVNEDQFVCPEDRVGLYKLEVTKGGTGAITYRFDAFAEGATVPELTSPWGVLNVYQGPAGLTFIGYAQDANGCTASATTFVPKPVEIKLDVKNGSCYGELKASARVTVTSGVAGRTYSVRYQKPDATWSGWFDMVDGYKKLTDLEYGKKYTFEVKDSKGCARTAENTFSPVPSLLNVCCETILPGECSGLVSLTIQGGIPFPTGNPYQVYIDGKLRADVAPWDLKAGTHSFKIVDYNGCEALYNVTIDANPVARTATAEAYVGEKVKFTDAEAKLDTMLAKGTHVFTYVFTNGCTRTLTVTVTEKYLTATIGVIQGTGDVSPLKDLPRGTTGTVTAVVPGVGYFIQDTKSALRNGLFVSDTKTTVLENSGVYVEGVVAEINGVTTLVAENVQFVTPEKITAKLVTSPSDVKNEDHESMLVTVSGARFMGTPNPDGSWVIKTTDTNTITVNDWMYPYTPISGDFYAVTGVINGAHDLYKLEPRKASDVVDLSKTTSSKEIDNLQFKVYPNPFSDALNIDNFDKLTRVTVTNIAGQRVIDIQYPERVIRTSNLVSGVYVITLFTEEGIAKSERMVKR